MPRRVQSRLRGTLFLTLALFATSLAITHHTMAARRESDRWVRHTLEVLAQLEGSLRAMREVESALRGYQLTGVPSDRAELARERAELMANLAALRRLCTDNPAQMERTALLAALARRYDGYAARVLADRSESLDAAVALAATREGRAITHEFDSHIDAMRTEEEALLEARRGKAERDEARTLWALAALGLLAAVVLVSTTQVTRHFIQRREVIEEELRRTNAFLDAIVENIPNMVFVKDAEQLRFRRLNRAGEALLGLPRGELLGKSDYDLFPAEQAAFFQEKDRDTLARGEVLVIPEEPIETPAGRRWLRTRKVTLLDAGGQPEFLLGISEDITEAKQREELLAASAARFKAVVEESAEAILLSDPEDARVIEANEAAAALFRIPRAELIGKTRTDLLVKDDEWVREQRARRVESGQYHGEIPLRRFDGTTFTAELSVNTFHDPSGEKRLTIFVRDVSARLAYEQSLIQAKVAAEAATKELEAFCYSVSHDLRAPLRAIDGFSQALLEDCGAALDGEGREYVMRVRRAAQRMAQLIDDLLRLSRLTRAELARQPVDLSQLAADVVRDLRASAPDRAVTVSIEPGLSAHADARLVRIAFENLLGNAWKFTSKRAAAHIRVAQTVHEGRSCFVVRDDGAGFEQAYRARLFGAFQRLHSPNEFEGSGIGLATVLRVVQRHGGSVWAEGRPGEGASFYFTLSPEVQSSAELRPDGTQAHLAG